MTSHMPFVLPQDLFNPSVLTNYPMMYQQVAAAAQAQAHAFTGAGAGLRPTIVTSQTPHLAATLQQAVPQGVAVTGAQPGLRLNPLMMVNVDPSRAAQSLPPLQPPYTQTPSVGDTGVAGSSITSHSACNTIVSHLGAPPPGVAASAVAAQPPGTSAPTQPNASPRPSILRKRTNEGITVVKKNIFPSMPEPGLADGIAGETMTTPQRPVASPKSSIPCDPNRENSQSSTDTASSVESTPHSAPSSEIKIKQEPPDTMENGLPSSGGLMSHSVEASPRKKPRKQLLNATEELRDATDTDEEEMDEFSVPIKQELEESFNEDIHEALEEFVDAEGVKWTREKKRPPISLLGHYSCTWKTRNNHFVRHTEVKPKEERRPTVNELANQKGVHQKASGWKLFHLAAQLEELMDMERDVFSNMTSVQEAIAPKHIAKHPTMEDDISMVHELTQGNIQRCQLVIDQLEEARASMLKVLDHRPRINDIVNKHHSKRPVKKKERS